MTDPQGPVVDWLTNLVAALWQMVLRLIADGKAFVGDIRADFGEVRTEVRLAFWTVVVLVVIHAVVTRPRKGVP